MSDRAEANNPDLGADSKLIGARRHKDRRGKKDLHARSDACPESASRINGSSMRPLVNNLPGIRAQKGWKSTFLG
jgi:hypothetical protein